MIIHKKIAEKVEITFIDGSSVTFNGDGADDLWYKLARTEYIFELHPRYRESGFDVPLADMIEAELVGN